uniref:ATP-binding protein n=1 Tax=Meloidogyne hapla TaxID=6305 RepID=A0A1I8BVA2_MELHA
MESPNQKLADAIVGLDEQQKHLEKILLEFGRTGLGGSCLICGRKRSGKSLVLDQIIKRHFIPSDVRIVNADGEKCSSFAASAKILQKHGLDIGNFDEEKYKKEIIESNGLSILEKRVRSRLSKIYIYFNAQLPLEEFKSGFFQLLRYTQIPKNIIKKLENESSIDKMLQKLFERVGMIAWLKKLVALYEMVYTRIGKMPDPVSSLNYCLEAILCENEQNRLLNKLSVRQLILLNCVAKLDGRNNRICEFNYREIINEYYRFSNENKNSMRVSDIVLYKDLQELVDLDLLVIAKKVDNGQLPYRRVMLNIEQEAIFDSVKMRKKLIPGPVIDWFYSDF